MAREIGISLSQHCNVGSEPAHDDEPGNRGCAGSHSRIGTKYGAGGVEKVARLPLGGRQEHCRKCRRTAETGGVIDNPADLAAFLKLPSKTHARAFLEEIEDTRHG